MTRNRAVFTITPAHTGHILTQGKTELWVCTRDLHPYYISGRARHTGGWVHQGPPSRLVLVAAPQSNAHRLSLRSVDKPPPGVISSEAVPRVLDANVSASDLLSPAEGVREHESVHSKTVSESEVEEGVTLRATTVSDSEVEEDVAARSTTIRDSEVGEGEVIRTTTVSDSEVEGEGAGPATHMMRESEAALINLKNNQPHVEGKISESNTDKPYVEESTELSEVSEEDKEPADVMLGDMPNPEVSDDVHRPSDAEKAVTHEVLSEKGRTSSGRAGVRASETFVDGDKEAVDLSDVMRDLLSDQVGALSKQPDSGSPQNGRTSESPQNGGPGSPVVAASSENAGRDDTVLPTGAQSTGMIRVLGLRVESHGKGIEYDEFSGSVLSYTEAEVRFFGEGITILSEVLFTAYEGEIGTTCGAHTTKAFKMMDVGDGWATATIKLPSMSSEQKRWFLCVRATEGDQAYHQGNDPWLTMTSYNLPLPLWIQACFIVLLLVLSGLFSGLNLGLMALDKTELKIVSNTGSPEERHYARAIEPVRRHGNFLLCTLLLGNVLVNSSLTILLDELSTGLIAVIGSTIGIVIFGEIIPQAICSRHGLAIGARTVWLVRVFMVITGPVSYPISKILDFVLGEEIGNTYDRERLKELIKVTHDHNDLRKEEQNIICGALELHKKTVGEVMTKLDDVYMLSVDTSLDFNTINEIMQQGYSRVPVYEGDRTNIITVLFTKDLAFIDPDDNTPLKTLCQFYQNPCNFVFVDTTLDIIFKEFKEGSKGHMAFVQRVNNEGDCDPFYEVLGLVTLEDVIEELIQEEIVDETDVFTDNRSKRRRQLIGRPDFTEFSHPGNQTNHKRVQISPQMQVAALQYLRTSIEPFKEGQLSEIIVKKLLNQDVIHSIKLRNKEHSKMDQHTYIYMQGKPVDYFALILEGHVEVTIGKENLTFESGPFTYFGMAALSQVQSIGESPSASTQLSKGSMLGSVQSLDSSKFSFTPDYSVRGITDVMYLRIRRSHYIAARRAFLLEQAQREPHAEEHFEKEMAKILIEDDGPSSPAWDNTLLAASNSKESSGMANGSAVMAFDEADGIEMTHQNIVNGDQKNLPSPAALNSGLKNSISVPGTPVSGHSSGSMKPSNSFTNLHEVPKLVSSTCVHAAQKENQKPLISETDTTLLTNNLSTSSIEDNGEQKVVGNLDVMPNMSSHVSLDYKQNNLDTEALFDHKNGSSFS